LITGAGRPLPVHVGFQRAGIDGMRDFPPPGSPDREPSPNTGKIIRNEIQYVNKRSWTRGRACSLRGSFVTTRSLSIKHPNHSANYILVISPLRILQT